jgi:hypothetical protein
MLPLNEKITEKLILERDRSKLPEGVLCSCIYPISEFDVLNRNLRKYSRALWEKVLSNKELQEKIKNRKLYGHAEHPSTTQSNLEKISHIIPRMWIDEGKGRIYQEMHILDTPYGRIVDTLLRAESLVGVSTRAEGELQEQVDEQGQKYMNVVAETFNYVTTDFTADESTPCALPEQIERDLVGHIQNGMAEKKMDKDFAVQMLERMKSTQAVALLENIKALKETDVHVAADGAVNVNANGVNVKVDGGTAASSASSVPPVPATVPPMPDSIPTTASTLPLEGALSPTAEKKEPGQKDKTKAKEVGSKNVGKITFECYSDMIKYFEHEMTEPKSEIRSKLVLSESKVVLESQKEVKALQIKIAETVAERDKVMEGFTVLEARVAAVEAELKTARESLDKGGKEGKEAAAKLTAQLTEAYQMNAKLRAKAEKADASEAVLAKGLKENKRLLDENTILKKELENLKATQDKVLIKKYVEAKSSTLQFTLSPNALTLLEACKTETEVDAMLEQFRDAMREKSLHLSGGAPQPIQESTPGAVPLATPSGGLEHSIGSLYGSLR